MPSPEEMQMFERAKYILNSIIPLPTQGPNMKAAEDAEYFILGMVRKFAMPVQLDQLLSWMDAKNFPCVHSVLNNSAPGGAAGSSSLIPRRPGQKSPLETRRGDSKRRERAKQSLREYAQQVTMNPKEPDTEKKMLIIGGIAVMFIENLTVVELNTIFDVKPQPGGKIAIAEKLIIPKMAASSSS